MTERSHFVCENTNKLEHHVDKIFSLSQCFPELSGESLPFWFFSLFFRRQFEVHSMSPSTIYYILLVFTDYFLYAWQQSFNYTQIINPLLNVTYTFLNYLAWNLYFNSTRFKDWLLHPFSGFIIMCEQYCCYLLVNDSLMISIM